MSPDDKVHNAATALDPYLVAQAQEAQEREKQLGFKSAVRNFAPGIMFSMVLSVALIMEGYDLSIIGSYWGHEWFLKRFGELQPDGRYKANPDWQAAVQNATNVGAIIGLAINGYCQYHFGSKKTYLAAMLAMIATIFVPVFATDIKILFAGNLLMGIPWGIFQVLTTAYAAELCPMALRAYLTSFVNICWACGLFIGAGVVRATLVVDSYWSYRLPYMLQWVWPVPLFICALFAPESPWFLVRKGRLDDARQALRKTARKGYFSEGDLDAQVALMRHTLEVERLETKNYSLLNCFRGSNLRRTEIACVVYAIQIWSGQQMTSLVTQLLTQAGMPEEEAFNINLGMTAMLFAGTVFVWGGMGRWGRRPIYLWGQVGVGVCLLGMAILGCVPQTNPILYGASAFIMILNFVFACSLGPVCYAIVAEIPAAEVRGPTIALARAVYVASGIVTGQLNPRMISQWGWSLKTAFFYLGTCALGVVYTYFRLPETQHRPFGELDVLFNNRVPARKFKSTSVDQFYESPAADDDKCAEAKEPVDHLEKV